MYYNEDIGFLIKLVGDTIETTTNQKLKPYDITLSQGRVLAYLNSRNGLKTSQKMLEDYFKVTHPTMIGILKRLVAKELVVSLVDPDDRRIRNIYLNNSKIKKAKIDRILTQNIQSDLLIGFEDDKVTELKEMLKGILHNINTNHA
jgi:MarR family multiple gene transcriptional regulator MgrA